MKRVITSLLVLSLVLFAVAYASAQEPISISATSSSATKLANGNTEITFVAELSLDVIPVTFNFHWGAE